MPPPEHSVRIRDGDREVEVSGNPAFVRQVLDDLPTLIGRLRGEAPGRSPITMPPAPEAHTAATTPTPTSPAAVASEPPAAPPTGRPASNGTGTGDRRRPPSSAAASLEEQIFEVLRGSGRPLAVAAIRQRLDGGDVTGQQVRRLLERAGARVVMSDERPATYSLR